MDRHLGAAVDGDVGGDLAAQLHHAQILDDEGVHIVLGGVADQLGKLGHFPVRDQGIQGKVNLHAPDVAVLHRLGQGLRCKILCALPRVKHAAAQVNGVGAVLHRGPEGLHGPGRCQ